MGFQWHCNHPKCNITGFADTKEQADSAHADHWEAVHGDPKWRWN